MPIRAASGRAFHLSERVLPVSVEEAEEEEAVEEPLAGLPDGREDAPLAMAVPEAAGPGGCTARRQRVSSLSFDVCQIDSLFSPELELSAIVVTASPKLIVGWPSSPIAEASIDMVSDSERPTQDVDHSRP